CRGHAQLRARLPHRAGGRCWSPAQRACREKRGIRPRGHRRESRRMRWKPHRWSNRTGRLRRHCAAAFAMTSGDGDIGVLVADGREPVRAGFCVILDAADGIKVLGEAADGGAAVARAAELRPDVVLMDIRMPGMDGLEAARLITGAPDPPKVVMLTT